MTEVSADQVLDLQRLRTALVGVVDLAITRFGPRLDLGQVSQYAMDDDPGLAIDAGQSTDDLDELEEMLEHPEDQALWHSATHLSELLRLVAFVDQPRGARRRPAGRQDPSEPPGQPR